MKTDLIEQFRTLLADADADYAADLEDAEITGERPDLDDRQIELPVEWVREAADRIAALEAEIEEMTPKFVAYEYLVSPAGEEMALEENARLRARIADLEAERRGLERAAEVAESRTPTHSARQTTAYAGGNDRMGEIHHARHVEAWEIGQAIRALIPEAPVREGWQPISSAPKDGTVVDLWHEDFGRQADFKWGHTEHSCGEAGRYCDSDWHSEEAGWVDTALNERFFSEDAFTHWRPLPPPPSQDREGDMRGAE